MISGIIVAGIAVASLVTDLVVKHNLAQKQKGQNNKQMAIAKEQAKKQALGDLQNFARTMDANSYGLAVNEQKGFEADRNKKFEHQRDVEHKRAEERMKNRGSYQTGSPVKG